MAIPRRSCPGIRCWTSAIEMSLWQGSTKARRRMTLTYPIINRSRRILWLVTGKEKSAMLARLRDGDVSIPAGRVRQDNAFVLADASCRGELDGPQRAS